MVEVVVGEVKQGLPGEVMIQVHFASVVVLEWN